MSSTSTDRLLSPYWLAVAGIVVLALLVTGTAAAQDGTATAATETCSGEEPAQLSQMALYATDETIGEENSGRAATRIQVNPASTCPVVVNVTLTPAAGVEVVGLRDVASIENDSLRTQFVLDPGEGTTGPELAVVANGTGPTYVEGNVTYWPEGHPELARSMSGFRVQFVTVTPSPTTERTTTGTGPMVTPGGVLAALVACLAAFSLRARRE